MADTTVYNLPLTHLEANVVMRAIAAHNDQLAREARTQKRPSVALDAQVGTWVVDRLLRLIAGS